MIPLTRGTCLEIDLQISAQHNAYSGDDLYYYHYIDIVFCWKQTALVEIPHRVIIYAHEDNYYKGITEEMVCNHKYVNSLLASMYQNINNNNTSVGRSHSVLKVTIMYIENS